MYTGMVKEWHCYAPSAECLHGLQEANKYTGEDPGVNVKNLFLKVLS